MPESTATKTSRQEANFKETIESILVAFILAFVFRAFVVEAFVIPTGSMAPTLYGAHIRYHCRDCGYTFDGGFKAPNSGGEEDPDIPSSSKPATDYHCPNCGYPVSEEVTDVRFGDRILVLKYLYLFQKPRQWDVVVFKSPDEQNHHVEKDPEYGMNYIKRLIATGPNSVAILDGDVYLAPAFSIASISTAGNTVTVSTTAPHSFSVGQPVMIAAVETADFNNTYTIASVVNPTTFTFTASPELTPAALTALRGGTASAGTPPPWKDNKKPPFRIQRKPGYVQDALWRVIYNNDFIPHLGSNLHDWTQPWQEEKPASGWKLSGGPTPVWPNQSPSRIFDFSNAQGGGTIAFHSDVNRPAGPSGRPIDALSDFLVYDEAEHRDGRSWQPVYVSDLKLACDYTRKTGDGPLRMVLSKKADVFIAEFTPDGGKGKVRLLRAQRVQSDPGTFINETELASKEIKALAGNNPARVELINVDYRVSVRVNGQEVLATTDDQYYPRIAELWEEESRAIQNGSGAPDQGPPEFAKPLVRIDAQRQEARLEHLVLSRDIYYLSIQNGRGDGPFWASVANIMTLNADEYFVMGDNSFISGDARYWKKEVNLPHEGLLVQSGRVPERFMLGKAFFVYWPAGYRAPFTSVNGVPDFGEMRFIR